MAISSLSGTSSLISHLIQGRRDLDDLQRQLTTGLRAQSYGGYDSAARVSILSLRSETSAIEGYRAVIQDASLRIQISEQALGRFDDLAHTYKSDAFSSTFDLVDGQRTALQINAQTSLEEVIGLLNQDINGRYLFAGRETDAPPVVSSQLMLYGDGTRAGLTQLISERRQADLGASGLGRLVVSSPAADTVRLAEEAAGLPFGFQIAGANADSAGVTVTGPAAAPATVDIAFSAQLPAPGEKIRVLLDLPDGSQEWLELKATDSTPPGTGEFTIGADAATTAANFNTALQAGLADLAATSLAAASAVQASDEFFAGTPSSPPLRVDGPPFDTATGLVAGTAANTVIWYQGEDGATPARQTALARIDEQLVVGYGLRADEEAMRNLVSKLAVLASTTFNASDATAEDRYTALNIRVGRALDFPGNMQSFADIRADIASSYKAMQAADERHVAGANLLETLIGEREQVSPEEVSVKLLSLQTRLQASMETTAMLANLSLVNFLR
jgi:flagellin-like hook-associated protein FlgL